jgi:hypothetical protein
MFIYGAVYVSLWWILGIVGSIHPEIWAFSVILIIGGIFGIVLPFINIVIDLWEDV